MENPVWVGMFLTHFANGGFWFCELYRGVVRKDLIGDEEFIGQCIINVQSDLGEGNKKGVVSVF